VTTVRIFQPARKLSCRDLPENPSQQREEGKSTGRKGSE